MKTRRIFMLIVFLLAVATLLPTSIGCGNKENVKKTESATYGIDCTFFSSDDIYLTKTVAAADGRVLRVINYNAGLREEYYYEDGVLEYTETYAVFDPTVLSVNHQIADEKLYETRFVYEGGRIVRGDVYYNETPTQSYDEYEYIESGALRAIRRYDQGEWRETYNYNGSPRPESYEYQYGKFFFEYDESGNLIKCTKFHEDGSQNDHITIEYANGLPTVAVKSSVVERVEVKYRYYDNGDLKLLGYVYQELDGESVVSSKAYDKHYNESGLLTKKNTDHGKMTDSVNVSYNGGKIKSIEYKNGSGETMTTVSFDYTEDGEILTKKYFGDGSDKVFEEYVYGESARPTSHIGYDASGDVFSRIEFEYYPNGVRKEKRTTADGTTVSLEYAENGNATAKTYNAYDWTEYVESDIAYGFHRGFSASDLFLDAAVTSVKRLISEGKVVQEYEYYENYSVRTITEYYSGGRYSVMEYSETGRGLKYTEYDQNGNVLSETVY